MDVFEKLGIDWKSLILYLVNFGIIVVVVAKYLWRPIISNIDTRRELIRSNIEESELLKNQFQNELKKKEAEHAIFVQTMQQEMNEAKKNARERADQLLAEAEAEKQEIVAVARTNAAEIQKQALQHLESALFERMQKTILFVLKNKVPSNVVEESVQDAWKQIEKNV